jgi:hypothetical protein
MQAACAARLAGCWRLHPVVPVTLQIYKEACSVIGSLNLRCAASDGPYLLGKRPCSLDAKVYGLLVYITAAATVAPVLQDALVHASSLQTYLSRIGEAHFGAAAPSYDDGAEAGQWSAAASGKAEQEARVETADDRRQLRRTWWWLGSVGVILAGYMVFGGNYVDFVVVEEEEEEET